MVRERSAKPLYVGSIPTRASIFHFGTEVLLSVFTSPTAPPMLISDWHSPWRQVSRLEGGDCERHAGIFFGGQISRRGNTHRVRRDADFSRSLPSGDTKVRDGGLHAIKHRGIESNFLFEGARDRDFARRLVADNDRAPGPLQVPARASLAVALMAVHQGATAECRRMTDVAALRSAFPFCRDLPWRQFPFPLRRNSRLIVPAHRPSRPDCRAEQRRVAGG